MDGNHGRQGLEGLFESEMATLRERIRELSQEGHSGDMTPTLLQDLTVAHEELRVAEEEIRTQQEELEVLLESHERRSRQHERLLSLLPLPVVTTDGAGVIRSLNPAAARLLNIRVDRAVRKPVVVFVDPEDRPRLRALVNRAEHSGIDFREVVTLHPRESPALCVEIAATVSREPWNDGTEITWMLNSQVGRTSHPRDPRPSLAQSLVELTRLPLQSRDPAELVRQASKVCERALGPGVSIAITLGPPTSPVAVGSSDKTAQQTGGAQMMSDEGPCQTAWETSTTVTSKDLGRDDRWKVLASHVHGTAVKGVLSVPIRAVDKQLGTLNVFRTDGAIDAGVARTAELLGSAVAAVFHEADVKAELESLSGNLRSALESRATIDQAKGIVMATRQCDAEEAFAYLAHMSSVSNIKLREVASRIVAMAAEGLGSDAARHFGEGAGS